VRRNALLVQPGKDSPFLKQGLQHLDVIVDVVGRDGTTRLSQLGPFQAEHVVRLLTGLPEGAEVALEFYRQGKPGQKQTRNFRIPPMAQSDVLTLKRVYADSYFFAGALLAALPAEVAHFHGGLRPNDGPLVTAIYGEGAFFKAGARRGDVLVATNPASGAAPCTFPNLSGFLQCLDAHGDRGPIQFTIVRGTQKTVITPLTIPAAIVAGIRSALRQRSTPPPQPRGAIRPGIESIAIDPQPVAAGQPFTVRVSFRIPDPGSAPGSNSTLNLRILAGSGVLFEEKPVAILAGSGTLIEHTFRLKAAAQPGAFVVEVSLEGASHRDTKSSALRVE
jgi:hypothetical protein